MHLDGHDQLYLHHDWFLHECWRFQVVQKEVANVAMTAIDRVEAKWQLDVPTSLIWRLRTRLQLERELDVSDRSTTSLTPFANVEFIWTISQDMWSQFCVQVGLRLGVVWYQDF